MANARVSLYQQIIIVTDKYLGPASERFISRQVENHLNKPATQLSQRDLPQLITWIQITISVITEDDGLVQEYVTELQEIYRQAGGSSKHA